MAQDNPPIRDSDAHLAPTENHRQTSVLLAEDDRALRRFIEVVLERAGYKVFSAKDGLEAMKLVLSASIDIVVTDAMMPNLSGQEFCRDGRQFEQDVEVAVRREGRRELRRVWQWVSCVCAEIG